MGNTLFLWIDNWHLKGPFFEKYEDRIIYDSRLQGNAKVKEIIYGENLRWLVANSTDLLEIKESIEGLWNTLSKC